MTKDELNQVLNAMDGFYVGYANVSTLKGIRTQQYVFNMTPENISGFLYTWKDRAGQILLTDMLDRPVLKMESGTIIQCKTRELEKQVYSLMCDIRSGKNAPARFPMVTRELFDAYIDMEESLVGEAEVEALAREEQQAALELGL